MPNGNGNNQLKLTLTGDPTEFQGVVQAMATPETLGGLFGHPAVQPMYPMPAPDTTAQDDSGGQPTLTQTPAAAPTPDATAPTAPSVLPPILGGTGAGPVGALPPIAPPASLYPGQGPLVAPPPGSARAEPAIPAAVRAQAPAELTPVGAALGQLPTGTDPAWGGRTAPAQVNAMPAPPRETTGQKILGALGKIGGIGLSALAPDVASLIPQTPLGKIVEQNRALAQQKLQLGVLQAGADIQKAQAQTAQAGAETQKARAEAEKTEKGEWRDVPNTNAMYNTATHQVVLLPPGVQRTNLPAPLTPLTPSEISQYNPILEDLYKGQNPQAKTVPPNYQLGTGATQGDYERIVTALEAANREAEARKGLAQTAEEAGARLAESKQAHEETLAATKAGKEQSRADRNFYVMKADMDKLRKPVGDLGTRLSAGITNINLNTPQADSVLAPEILSISAGGPGSGVRMNEAEINRIVGSQTIWTQLKAAANKWSTDPNHPQIPVAQRQQMLQILQAAQDKVKNKEQVLDWGDQALINSDDIKEQRQIVAEVQKMVEAIDNGKTVRIKQNAQ